MRLGRAICGTALFLGTLLAHGQDDHPPAPAATPDFVRDVQPILVQHCVKCHGPAKQKGRLRLDTRAHALRGGVSGKAILPNLGAESRLIKILADPNPDERMPQDAEPLPATLIATLRIWIDQGAVWPDSAAGPDPAPERHWAYEKPLRRDPPAVQNSAWVRNPVDRFIAAEHETRGLRPRPEAPKPLLLRRLYLDLVGLPPTPEEREAFLSDPDPQAYEKLVDRLLADPRYGERWGRHWMDVWRYSDWAGFADQIRESQRHLWRWRDWIVESLNADKGYDRMIQEMLAGDELAPDDPEVLRATGFLARNWNKFNRNAWLQNTVEHTSKAFLGTTLNCARCHSHMFDPISHEEYYRYRAFFEPYNVRTDRIPGQTDIEKDGLSRIFDADPKAATWLFVRGEESRPDKTRPIAPGVPAALGGIPIAIKPVALPPAAVAPDQRDFVRRDLLEAGAKALEKARAGVSASLNAVQTQEQALASGADAAKARPLLQAALEELPVALLAVPIAEARQAALAAVLEAERREEAGDRTSEAYTKTARAAQAAQRTLAVLEAQQAVFLARRTLTRTPTDAAVKNKLADSERALTKAEAEAALPPGADYVRRSLPSYPPASTGRRLALARWIASTENPLTARVAINQLWMRHFGKPLVPTVFEFGKHGRAPTHPALLDWLATEFMREGWSMKTMHRLLVTSSTYRMASSFDPACAALDKDNQYWWRMNSRRMEAELVRDSILQAAGVLDPARGGPDLDPNQGLTSFRRSLYFRHAAEKQVEFLTIFDAANVTECYERTESVVPQQALALANSALSFDMAHRVAFSLKAETDFIGRAFERILGRAPTAAEREECQGSFHDTDRSRESLVHVLFNHHDFVTIR